MSEASAPLPFTHRGTRAIQVMVEHAPASGGLALWMLHRDADGEDAPAIAANDGRRIVYGPGIERLPAAQQTGVVAHQVLHVALRHAQRRRDLAGVLGDVDARLFNVCADAIVNSALGHLGWLALPPGSVTLETLLRETLHIVEPVQKSLLEWDVERLYRAVDDRAPASGQPRRDASGRGRRGGAGEHADPRESRATAARADGPRAAAARALGADIIADLLPEAGEEHPEDAADAVREWAERLTRAHAGDGEFSLLRALLADLPRSHTPWEQVLRTQITRGLAPVSELSWSRPSRSWIANRGRTPGGHRMPWEPGVTASRSVPRLAVMVDVSGSIDDELLARFGREVEAITRRTGAALSVIVGDDRVRHVQHFEPGRSNLAELRCHGGGGTDFAPLIAAAGRHRPDIGVLLTDLLGPAGHAPRWPLLWAVPPASAEEPVPFGRLLVLRD